MPSSTTAAEGKRDDTRSRNPVEEHVRVDHIAVCICTYRRPAELTKLLSEIEKQQTRGSFTFSVVVVDNDAAESAKAVVEAFAAGSSVRVEYFCERTQNISLARNRAVMNATGEYVALIDDDEWPGAQWLLNSYEAARRYKADGVLGPVRPCFEHDPPQWVVRGRFHEKPRHKPPQTGAVLKWNETRTSNVLLKRDVFGDGADLFDPRFGLGGGEDVDFFGRMIAKGRVFVWCQQAHVFELISPERFKRTDMLRRALVAWQDVGIAANGRRSRFAQVRGRCPALHGGLTGAVLHGASRFHDLPGEVLRPFRETDYCLSLATDQGEIRHESMTLGSVVVP